MYRFYFEKLEVWKDSIEFIKFIYLFTKLFPEEEKFGMTSQIRRASVSISTNISEGSSRSTKKDQANFTNMAYTSLMETMNLIIVAYEIGYIQDKDYERMRAVVEKIANKLNALYRVQLRESLKK